VSAEESRDQAAETGDRDASETMDQAAQGGEGVNPAQGTPPIGGSEQQPGQTAVPAPEEDVGVPEGVEERTE
jgi:hypothetical protein